MSKVLIVLLALVAVGVVGFLALGREGLERLFGLSHHEAEEQGGDGLQGAGAGGGGADEGTDGAHRRGPVLANSRRLARVGKGALVGRALDVRTAKGVAKAAVSLAGTGLAGETVALTSETAPDGAFRLADVAAGLDYALRIEAPGLASLDLRGVVVTADGVLDLGDLWLGKPGALEGFVLDPAGQGLTGVEVQLHRGMASLREFLQSGGFVDLFMNLDREPEPLAKVTTKAKGAFRIEGAFAGPMALVVRAPGYKQAIVSVTLTADAGHEPVKVRLSPGATMGGKVADAQGQAMGGVHLAAFSQDGGMPSPLQRTFADSAADGTFQFTSLAGEGRFMVVASSAGFPNTFVQANAGDTDVRVVMKRGATLEVRVLSDAGDTPIAGAQVLVAIGDKTKMDEGPGSLVGGLTDATGAVVLEVFPGELQMAILSAPGYPPNFYEPSGRMGGQGVKGPEDGTVPAGRSTMTFRLPQGVKLTGKVSDMDGNPLAGAEVTTLGFMGGGEKTISGADGSYELNLITAEFGMGVIARLPGWVQEDTKGPDGEEPARNRRSTAPTKLDIRMRRSTTVTGRVLDPGDLPVAGATVSVRRERENSRFDIAAMLGANATSITLANGTYAVDGVPAEGKVRVIANRDGFVSGGTEPFEVGKELTKAPDVRLLAGATLEVKVVGPDGQGVPGARVRVEVARADKVQVEDWEDVFARQSGKHDLRTGASGTTEASLLPPGKVTLRVTAAGFGPSGAHATIGSEGGPKEPVTVRLKPGVVFSGRVVDGDGHPLEGAAVRVIEVRLPKTVAIPLGDGAPADTAPEEEDWFEEWDRQYRATTDSLGRWGIKGLPERPFQVSASKDGYTGKQQDTGEDHASIEVRLVKLDPEAQKRIEEIDKELQDLYKQFQGASEEAQQALMTKLQKLQEEKRRLGGTDR